MLITFEELKEATKPLVNLLQQKGNQLMVLWVTDERVDLYSAEAKEPVDKDEK